MKVGWEAPWPNNKRSQRVYILCPGCKDTHHLKIEDDQDGPKVHTFNGDFERPTFSPSLLLHYKIVQGHPDVVCHSFVRDGMIQFLGDCTHELKGQTVPLPDVEEIHDR